MRERTTEPRQSPRLLWPAFLLLCLFVVAGPCKSILAQKTQKLPSAEKVVENYLKAIGGKKKAASIRDATYDWTVQLGDQSLGLAKIQVQSPASERVELTFGNGQIVWAANPRSAWVRGLDGGLRTLTGPEAAAAKLEAALNATHFVDYKKANALARIVSLENSTAGPVYVVEFSTRGGAHAKYLFSPATKLLVGIRREERKTAWWFEDYRAEGGGILEPHTVRLDQTGAELTLKLQHATYNSGVASTVFDPPRAAETLDVLALLKEVTFNQDEIEKRFLEYSFLRKETNRDIDGKGVVKKETVKVYEVFPLPNHEPILKLISENGVTLSGERAAKEEKRVQEEFLKADRDKDRDAQKAAARRDEQQRKAAKKEKGSEEDIGISQFFRNCEFISPRRERFQDRETIVFDFRAKPGFKPRTREEDLISKLVGVVWIDPLDKQVIRLEARLAEGFKMAGGLLISLRPGAALVWEQTRLKEGIWMPRFVQINLSLKVLLFGGGDINQTVEWSDYKHFSADVDSYKLGQPKTEEPPVKKPD